MHGFSRLDELPLHAPRIRPRIQRFPGEFGPIIHRDPRRDTALRTQPLELTHDPSARHTRIDHNGKAFPSLPIDHREHANPASRCQRVINKIHRPAFINPRWGRRDDPGGTGDSFPAFAPQRQASGTIEPIHPFMIDHMALAAEQHTETTIAKPWSQGRERQQAFRNDRR